MGKSFYIVHLITLILIVISIISLFKTNIFVAAIPVATYILIHRKNSLLLYYTKIVESKISGLKVKVDSEATDLFFGRELFVLGIMNFLMAINYSTIANLIAAAWVFYLSIVKLKYIKI